jgi:outer membrane murein-binding lipoprotein Lpp
MRNLPNIWVGLGIVILTLTGLLGIQTWRLDKVQKEFITYQAQVAVLNKVNQDRFNTQKGKIDAANKKLRADNVALNKRLRDERASSNYVPPAGPTSTSPERVTFKRGELERTIQSLDVAIQGLIDEGDRARLNLDSAKEWARDVTN